MIDYDEACRIAAHKLIEMQSSNSSMATGFISTWNEKHENFVIFSLGKSITPPQTAISNNVISVDETTKFDEVIQIKVDLTTGDVSVVSA